MLNHSVTEQDITDDDCYLDENEGEERGYQIFDFLEVSSFAAVISYNPYKPAYIMNINEKDEASEEIKDPHEHSLTHGELFLRVTYLKPERSRNISQKMFTLVPVDVACDPDEVFHVFFDIDSNLSMSKKAYLVLVVGSS